MFLSVSVLSVQHCTIDRLLLSCLLFLFSIRLPLPVIAAVLDEHNRPCAFASSCLLCTASVVPSCQLCGIMNASAAVYAGLLPSPTYLCQVILELLMPSLCVGHVRPNLMTLSTLFSISTAVSVGQSSFPSPPSACPRAFHLAPRATA